LHTCQLDEKRWQNWLALDLINLAPLHADALRSLRALYLDVGRYDQYNIQFGTRQLVSVLKSLDINFHYEEFNGNHSGMDWRLDYSLPFLAKALNSDLPAAS
jgi:hypothetical protein